jgi:TRAP-type C4-dicarboxylate transport system permease small subunit
MLIWIGVLGAAYAYRSKMHLGLDLLVNHLQGKSRIAAELASTFFVAAFAIVVMLVGGSLLVQLTWELNQESAAIGIKMAYIYSCIPLSGAIIMLYAIDAACDTLFQPSRSEDQ